MASGQAYVAALIALAACEQRERPTPVPVAVEAPRSIDARVYAELPPSTHAAIAAPPRDQWPCAFHVREDQGIQAQGESVFTYGNRTGCRMPVELVAQGIWGCPDKFVRTDSDGMVRDRHFKYDKDGRLVDYSGFMHWTYAWEGDRLLSTTTENVDGPHTVTYVDDGDRVISLEKGERTQEMRLEQGKVVQLDEYLYGRLADTARVQWQGDRPLRVDVQVHGPVRGSVQRTFRYDCD